MFGTKLINNSLLMGEVPSIFKPAPVIPLLNKPNLDQGSLSIYRSISNLPFLSKALEKVVANQLQSHLSSNQLYKVFQSGFWPLHSTRNRSG
jgi:hypothetical protein